MMRTKKGELRHHSFPAIAKAHRVQQEGKRLGLSLTDSNELRTALRLLLDRLAKKEREVADAERQNGNKPDRPVADPAKKLLGLTPGTESKGIGEREKAAAESRRVSPRTMRNPEHGEQIAHEIAAFLSEIEGDLAKETPSIFHQLQHLSDSPLEWSELDDALHLLQRDELRQLAVEVVASYRPAAKALIRLSDELELPSLAEEDRVYESLQALAARGFDSILDHLPAFMLKAEVSNERSRYVWLARTLRVLTFYMPHFTPRNRALLQHAAERAGGNLHVFISALEDSPRGIDILNEWKQELFWECNNTESGVGALYRRIQTGLEIAEQLTSPREIGEHDLTSLRAWGYLLLRGDKRDLEWTVELTRGQEKDGKPMIEDDAKDRQFLERLALDSR